MHSHRFRVPAVTCVTKFRQIGSLDRSSVVPAQLGRLTPVQPSANAPASRPPRDDEKMRAHAEEGRLGL
jgi:hypothetical protein